MQNPPESIQSAFLEQLRKNLPKNVSFADELAELLSISRDSVYRRIRGETVLSLDEVRILTNHFKISMDSFLTPVSDQVTFQLKSLNQEDFTFEKWLQSILGHLETIDSYPEEKDLIYDAKDLPIFHFFQFPRLAAFKLYFWKNSFSRQTKLTEGKYDGAMIGRELLAMGERIWQKYSQVPCTEIIRYEIVTITLRQIEYLHESGMFHDKNEARALCDDCSQMMAHLQHQARTGSKITFGQREGGAKYELYVNDVLIGGNTILFRLKDKRITFITPNNFDILMTSSIPFCQLTEDHMHNLVDKSVMISATAEKERKKFFNRVEEKIQETKARII